MLQVIDKLVEVLTAAPSPVLPAGRLGPVRPSASAEIPAAVISLTLETVSGSGIGRFVRAGDSIVQATNVIEVKATPDTFSTNLKSLRISPLPLKKNPSSTAREFTGNDLRIRNVTNPANPVPYTMAGKPAVRTQYRLDRATAEVIFGEAQVAGEKLEVAHWTVTWRDEILGDSYRGLLAFEIWADSFNHTQDISRRLQERLRSERAVLRDKGFTSLKPRSLGPIENVLQSPGAGAPFPVWKQELGYKFAFEAEEGGELSGGVPIKRIDAGLDDFLVESFSIP